MKKNLDKEINGIASKFSWNRDQLAPRDSFVTILESRLTKELHRTKPNPHWNRRRIPAWQFGLAMVALLFVVVFAIGPTDVYARIRSLLGFVDGFGTVSSEETVRTLSFPVSQTKDGVTVTVYDALFTSEKTALRYNISGLNNSDYVFGPDQKECIEPEKIRLPDGTIQSIQSPIPDSVNSFELILACIPGTVIGNVPDDWIIPVTINHDLGSKIVYPLEETTPKVEETIALTEQESFADIYIEVGRVVKTDDSYILIGTEVTRRPTGWTVIRTDLTITDADGKPVEFTDPDGATTGSDFAYGVDRFPWAIQFSSAGVTFPIKISTESKSFEPVEGDEWAEFMVDVGQNPQSGQVFDVNQSVLFAGDTVRLNKITAFKNGYSFNFSLGGKISNLSVSLQNCKGYSSGGVGFAAVEPETMSQSIFCENTPIGVLTIVLTDAYVSHDRTTTDVFWAPD
jgi:hypothetical protein